MCLHTNKCDKFYSDNVSPNHPTTKTKITYLKNPVSLSAPAGSWQNLSAAALWPAFTKIWWDREAIQYLVFVFWEHLNYRMVPVHLWSHHADGGCVGLCGAVVGCGSAPAEQRAGQCPPLSVLTDGRLCYLWPVTPTPTTPTAVDGWRRQNSLSL